MHATTHFRDWQAATPKVVEAKLKDGAWVAHHNSCALLGGLIGGTTELPPTAPLAPAGITIAINFWWQSAASELLQQQAPTHGYYYLRQVWGLLALIPT